MAYVKSYKNLKSINSDFIILSKFFEKKLGKFWWFFNITRLDLALWGMPQKKNIFTYSTISQFITIFKFIFSLAKKLFQKNEKINFGKYYIFVFEDFKLFLPSLFIKYFR